MSMNQSRILLLAAALGALALAACQPKTASPVDNSPPVATVNGEPITRDFYEFYIKGITNKTAGQLTPEQRGRALDNLIHARLVAQEAVKEGLDKRGDTPYLLELSRLNVLQQAVSDNYLKNKQPTDEELHAEYDTQVAAMAKQEYHARHILVATEPFAQKIVERLEKGEKFEDLAKAESMDSSRNNGGDLGWVVPDRMPAEFSRALLALKPGEYTKKPVQTPYGWHVIELVETRPLTPPPYDQVKQRLEQMVQAKKFKLYVDDMMRNAKITNTLEQSTGTSGAAGAPAASGTSAPATSGTSAPASSGTPAPPPRN